MAAHADGTDTPSASSGSCATPVRDGEEPWQDMRRIVVHGNMLRIGTLRDLCGIGTVRDLRARIDFRRPHATRKTPRKTRPSAVAPGIDGRGWPEKRPGLPAW
ncbi:MAG: hypothetical protein LBR22_02080 [Desulfovibrio sp.]|nr:hypothetical protein [Desulfovibrio sp.]